MWKRSTLKQNAKVRVKANYWKTVVASLILMGLGSAGAGTASSTSDTDSASGEAILDSLKNLTDVESFMVMLGALLVLIVIAVCTNLAVSLFAKNPIEVGAKRLFINCKDNSAGFGDLLFSFKNKYGNIVKVMFIRDIFISLWSLLFVIPGIVKSYEYRMIPYLLAEHPDMNRKEAFAKSKAMMNGNKWRVFVLDLSFIGWNILSICTLGILEILYVAPYRNLTDTELYYALRKE